VELTERTFRQIASLMHTVCGLSFADNKRPLVSSRLASRIQKLGLRSFEEYLTLIEAHDDAGGELQTAVDLLTTNETYFFREPAHFALLEQELSKLGKHKLSIWSAACSYGDEPYTLAMLLADMQMQGRIGSEWSILGTDISDKVLTAARDGVFPEERLRSVSPDRLRRYCLRGEGDSAGLVQLKQTLRERVQFGWLNLCNEIEQLGPFDAVFLRNVLIYFDPPTKAQVVRRVLSQLRLNGLFFVGTAEGRIAEIANLRSVVPGAFRKVAE